MSQRQFFPGWYVVIGSGLGIAFSSVVFAGSAVAQLGSAWQAAFGWTQADIAKAASIQLLLQMLAFPVTGWALDRWGSQRVASVSIILFGLCLVGLSQISNSLAQLYAMFALIGLLAAGTNVVSYARALSLWFDRKRGLALGLASGSQALGGVILPLLITTLVARAGWQSAVLALAAIQLLVCLPLVWMLVGDSPAPYGWLPDGDEARGQPKTLQVAGFTAIAVLRQPEFWRLAACFAVLGMCMYAVLINIVLILGKTASMTPAEVARFQAIAGVAVLIGRVGFGYLLDRWSARMVAILAVVCGAAGVAMYAHPASPALLLVGTLLIGASVGGESDLLPYLASRYFGTRSLSTVFGLFLSVFFIGAALGPTLFALVAGSDNVVPALHMLIGLYAIPILLFLTMGAPRLPRSDQWHAGLAGKE